MPNLADLAHTSRVSAVGFAPDGRAVVSGGFDGRILNWDIATGAVSGSALMPEKPGGGRPWQIWSIATDSSRDRVVLGVEDGGIYVWAQGDKQPTETFCGHTAPVAGLAVSADGRWLASASFDNTIRLWDLLSGRASQQLAGPDAECRAVAFSRDGELLAVGGDDCRVHIFRAGTGKLLRSFEGHSDVVTGVAFLPGGDQVISCSADQSVRWWSCASGVELATHSRHEDRVTAVSVSPDGRQVATASANGTVDFADALTAEKVGQLEQGVYWMHALAYSPDGTLVATGSEDKRVILWSSASHESIWGLSVSASSKPKAAKVGGDVDWDHAELYREGNIDECQYEFRGVARIELSSDDASETVSVDATAKARSRKSARNPQQQAALSWLDRVGEDAEIRLVVHPKSGTTETGQVSGNWQGRDYRMTYVIEWEAGSLETVSMSTSDIRELLEGKSLDEWNADDLEDLSPDDLRGGSASYDDPLWVEPTRVRSARKKR